LFVGRNNYKTELDAVMHLTFGAFFSDKTEKLIVITPK